MFRRQIIISFDDLMQIRFHELKNNVYVFEFPSGRRQQDVLDLHNIRVPKESKKFNFTKDSGCIGDMFEDIIYFFNRNFFTSMRIICGANNTITSFANYFLYPISATLAIFSEKVQFCG